jgi:hypothetical protein
MDRPTEVQRDGRATPLDIQFNTRLSSMELRIFNDHEMFSSLLRDPKAAKLYRIEKTKA